MMDDRPWHRYNHGRFAVFRSSGKASGFDRHVLGVADRYEADEVRSTPESDLRLE